ncbi:uncharacterized protein BX664DRAFT_330319 [Halteromyces radiatus]|uniref:uncharacterized protein n=1 Tax=Halteromyces radiatus TaxID=101107 RepID=UPI00221E99D0|nr:uncharacterized protein BX664DRAFT_330319 [Halteromyces radiatus]KAI8093682.1 hypothetical protein BX664DRAFT_330319 [Halteromyces radiatus]
MDKRKLLHEAIEWFMATFQVITNYETANDYAEIALYMLPYTKTEEHFLFASKLAIMMGMMDDSFNEQEFVVLLNYLKTSVVNEPSPFVSAIIRVFADFKAVSIYEENYNNMVKYIVAFIESTKGKKSNDRMDRIIDTCMIPFYITSLDSNRILADMNNYKLLDSAYGTRIDNDVLTYPKDYISDYMSKHSNPVYAGISMGDQVDAIKNDFVTQLLYLEPTLEDAIYFQGRNGAFLWSLFTKRYGRILKTVYEDTQTVGNIRNDINENVVISAKKHYFL